MAVIKNILLVDDNDDDAFIIDRAFTSANIPASICRCIDGNEAIKYLEGEAPFANRKLYPLPDLILLDLKIPHRDGLEVLEWIRRHPSFHNMIIVILSSMASKSEMEKAYALHANACLIKPGSASSMHELAQCIDVCWLRNHPKSLT